MAGNSKMLSEERGFTPRQSDDGEATPQAPANPTSTTTAIFPAPPNVDKDIVQPLPGMDDDLQKLCKDVGLGDTENLTLSRRDTTPNVGEHGSALDPSAPRFEGIPLYTNGPSIVTRTGRVWVADAGAGPSRSIVPSRPPPSELEGCLEGTLDGATEVNEGQYPYEDDEETVEGKGKAPVRTIPATGDIADEALHKIPDPYAGGALAETEEDTTAAELRAGSQPSFALPALAHKPAAGPPGAISALVQTSLAPSSTFSSFSSSETSTPSSRSTLDHIWAPGSLRARLPSKVAAAVGVSTVLFLASGVVFGVRVAHREATDAPVFLITGAVWVIGLLGAHHVTRKKKKERRAGTGGGLLPVYHQRDGVGMDGREMQELQPAKEQKQQKEQKEQKKQKQQKQQL